MIIVLVLFSLFGCKKSTDYVPNVAVNIYLYSTEPAFTQLNVTGGYTYLSGGSKCIVVFCKSQSPTYEFMAYDRHCTYKVADGNTVSVDASGLIATDAACGSQFLLTDGSVNKGPASNLLKRYQVTFDGAVLHIFN